MRSLILTFLALAALAASAAEPTYPLWDGHETIAEYAKRTGLEPTKTLDLGDGVKLELVLIPAGKFVMGTEEPKPVDEEGFKSKILTGQVVLGIGGGALLVLLGVVLVRAIRKRRRPQFSLAWFLAMTVAAGIGLLGGIHWWYTARAFAQAQSEYQADSTRFKSSFDSDKPGHWVTLNTPYYMGKFEVTQTQYQQIMATNPSTFKGLELPVEEVSWDDALDFCKKTSEKTGWVVRLPTEAEWEYACRAGTKTTYCTGDSETDLDRAAWYYENSRSTTHPVGKKTPNEWGLYDMHGNVWECCADWYETYKAEAVVDPRGPKQGVGRVVRGGSMDYEPGHCRSAYRGGKNPIDDVPCVGFRVVASIPKAP
jgi:formylglycine-generating enzyme required for sulfatase activity